MRAAVIYTEGDVRIVLQQVPQTFHLVVGKRIHRINKDRPHTGGKSPGFSLFQQMVNNRYNKALGFTGTGSCRYDEVLSVIGFAQGPFLVKIEPPVDLDLLVTIGNVSFQLPEKGRGFSFFNQFTQAFPCLVGIADIKIRTFGNSPVLPQRLLKLRGIVFIRYVEQGRNISDKFIFDIVCCSNGIEHVYILSVLYKYRSALE